MLSKFQSYLFEIDSRKNHYVYMKLGNFIQDVRIFIQRRIVG